MNVRRTLGNIVKVSEFIFVAAAYLIYVVLTLLTASDINDSLYQSLTYFIFIHAILMPLYLFFVGRHDTYVNLLYCHVRFKSMRRAFLVRIIYLLAETAMFIIPYVIMIFVFAILSKVNLSFFTLALCGINLFLNFFIAGIAACAVSVKSRKDYLGAITVYIILCIDFMFTLNFMGWDFSFYYKPMLDVFEFTQITEIAEALAVSAVKTASVLGCAYLLFIFKKDNIQ